MPVSNTIAKWDGEKTTLDDGPITLGNGDYCDAISAHRSATLIKSMECGDEKKIKSVEESSTCVYEFTIQTVCESGE